MFEKPEERENLNPFRVKSLSEFLGSVTSMAHTLTIPTIEESLKAALDPNNPFNKIMAGFIGELKAMEKANGGKAVVTQARARQVVADMCEELVRALRAYKPTE